jgi:predicted aconitase
MKQKLKRIDLINLYNKFDCNDWKNKIKKYLEESAWELGHGEVVCNVVGKSGGVAISHLEKITPGSLIAAKIRGITEISDEDIKSATEKFFKDKGVNIRVN